MKAIAAGLAAFGLYATASASAALAQGAPPDPGATRVVASPSTGAKRTMRRARPARGSAGQGGGAQGISGADTARGTARAQGATAGPAKAALAAGTLDLGNGLTFLLNYTSESAANPIGGIRQGTAYTAQVFFGVDADLSRIAGIDGATFHAIVTQRHGRSLSGDFIGNDTSVQEIFGGGQTSRLTLLSYQQKLFDNRLDVEVG